MKKDELKDKDNTSSTSNELGVFKYTSEEAKIKAEEIEKQAASQELYKLLAAPIPEEMTFDYEEDNKTFTGYHAQYAINLLNEKIGFGKWYTYEEIIKQEIINRSWFVAMRVSINVELPSGCHTVTGYSASYSKRAENAYKAAKTSAFKNACRYLGIGNELYLKGFEEDIILPSEAATADTPVSLGEQAQTLQNQIREAKTVEELSALNESVTSLEGKAIKEILIKNYNDRMIELQDQK